MVLPELLLPIGEIISKYEGKLEFEDLRTITKVEGKSERTIVVSRATEMKIVHDTTGINLSQYTIPYGAELFKVPATLWPKVT